MSFELWHQLFPSLPVFALMCATVLLAGTIRSFTGFGGPLLVVVFADRGGYDADILYLAK